MESAELPIIKNTSGISGNVLSYTDNQEELDYKSPIKLFTTAYFNIM